ncbi:MAG: cytidine deaminase [Tissierellia bacterium]|nr:cytidine deaminase [Tissierellia bacterium]
MVNVEQLIKKAIENKKNSYSPYSKFRVSAVVVTDTGKVFYGVNIENASYSPTICAERSAISAAISSGERKIDTIIITGDSGYTYPCGVCRQVIREFMDKDGKIIIAKDENDYKIFSIDDLLPNSFSKEDVENV